MPNYIDVVEEFCLDVVRERRRCSSNEISDSMAKLPVNAAKSRSKVVNEVTRALSDLSDICEEDSHGRRHGDPPLDREGARGRYIYFLRGK